MIRREEDVWDQRVADERHLLHSTPSFVLYLDSRVSGIYHRCRLSKLPSVDFDIYRGFIQQVCYICRQVHQPGAAWVFTVKLENVLDLVFSTIYPLTLFSLAES